MENIVELHRETNEDDNTDWCAECCVVSAYEIIKKIQNKR